MGAVQAFVRVIGSVSGGLLTGFWMIWRGRLCMVGYGTHGRRDAEGFGVGGGG